MSARRLIIAAVALVSLVLAGSAQAAIVYFGPAQGIDANSGSQPNYFEVPVPVSSTSGYEAFLGTQRLFQGPQSGQIVQVTTFTGNAGASPIDNSALLTFLDQGSNITVLTVTPLGPLPAGLGQFQLATPVPLNPGEGIAIAIRSNASSGPAMDYGAFDVAGVTSFMTQNYPGTTGQHPKLFMANNPDVALGTYVDVPNGGMQYAFQQFLNRKERVGQITVDVEASQGTEATFRGGYMYIGATSNYPRQRGDVERHRLKLKPKTVTLDGGETTVRLKFKDNRDAVKEITEGLEEIPAARKEKLKLTTKVTFPDGTTETEKDKAKLKP
jgi:hypothetical protein